MRKLVTIQKILNIEPIPNADFIELATVMGWQAVVKKGEFKIGDFCVYFEVDSFLPEDSRYSFLNDNLRYSDFYEEKGYWIKSKKLKQTLSQGLIMPLSSFPELKDEDILIGDIAKILNVKKWEIIPSENKGSLMIGIKPFGIPTTNEIRIQSMPEYLEKIKGNPYYITVKMDGTSMSVYKKDNNIGVTGKNYEYEEKKDCIYWKAAHQYDLINKLKEYNKNIVIQGELCGPKIQNNRIGLKNKEFFVFDVYDLDSGNYFTKKEIKDFTEKFNLLMVPSIEEGKSFSYNQKDLLKIADGFYFADIQKPQEGIVVRNLETDIAKRISFKVLNNNYLLKNKI